MTKLQKTLQIAGSVATILAVSPLSVFADEVIDLQVAAEKGTFGALGDITFVKLVSAALNFILIAAALIAFFFLLIGGVQWIMAGGDKEGTEKARKKITNALIGLAIVFSAYALAFLVNAMFGVNILSLTIKPITSY